MKIKYNPSKDPRVQDFNDFISNNYPQFLDETQPELLLVAGGDGSMLHAINDNISNDLLFFGKGLGTLNFLMNKFENDKEILEGLINDEIKLDTFNAYAIDVLLNDKKLGEAVNDVIIGNSLMDYYTIELTSEFGDFNKFQLKGCGICISTPIGSTAFNFNNNGRILPLGSCLLSVTGIVCNKYLNDILQFQKIDIKSNGGKIFLSGIESVELKETDTLTIQKGHKVQIAFLDKKEFLGKRVEMAHRYRK